MAALNLSPDDVGSLLPEGRIRIAVLGLGRIGLPTAALLADAGAQVVGVDINPDVVRATNEGECRFVDEPGLPEIVHRVVARGKLTATTDATGAIAQADFTIVCVPTPVDAAKSPDYAAIRDAASAIGRSVRRGAVVIVESTVGPGVVEDFVRSIIERESGLRAGTDFGLASCPERSDPGNIVANMRRVPRVVGAINGQCLDIVAALYRAAFGVQVLRVSNPKTANAIKLTENLFRDVNIALANEFALLFEKLGIDTIEVIDACATKYNFMPHYPGAGVGGPCLPSNSHYLIVEGVKSGNIPYLIRLAREINDRMPDHVVALVGEALNEIGKTVKGSKIAVLGVAYKPNIRDVQLTPVEGICRKLTEMGATIEVYDPMFAGQDVLGYRVRSGLVDAVQGADCVVVGTAHQEFMRLDLSKLAETTAAQVALVDARNVVDPVRAKGAGFAYRGVGRPPSGDSRPERPASTTKSGDVLVPEVQSRS